jgi:hypothetical protein
MFAKWINRFLLVTLLFLYAPADTTAHASDTRNYLFSFTHLAPSPFTLRSGQFVYGTVFAYGLNDYWQIGTNVLRDFYQIYNAHTKISLYDDSQIAFAAHFGFESYNVRTINPLLVSTDVMAFQPGVTGAYSINSRVASITSLSYSIQTVVSGFASGYVRGTRIHSDLAWLYGDLKRKTLTVLTPGVSYDFTYGVYGVGLSHHWPGFQLGFHYYVNATSNQLVPILSGGGSVQF